MIKTQFIAVVMPDDSVVIMQMILEAPLSSFSPDVAEANKFRLRRDKTAWKRTLDDEDINVEIGRTFPGVTVKGWQKVTEKDVPKDRTYRDALRLDGKKLTHDMPKARDLLRDRLRALRSPALAELDRKYTQADEAGDAKEKMRIGARRQALRDLPADLRIEQAQTINDLPAAELPGS